MKPLTVIVGGFFISIDLLIMLKSVSASLTSKRSVLPVTFIYSYLNLITHQTGIFTH